MFIEKVTVDNGDGTTSVQNILTTNPIAADGVTNNPIAPGSIREVFLGDSPSPRVTAGIGVNWNSPFGPFRIDFAQTIRKVEGDDDKTLTFNVGTQF